MQSPPRNQEYLTVCMRFKVIGHTTKEDILSKMAAQHADNRASLKIADMVKNLVDLKSISHGYFDGVGSAQRVELEGLLNTLSLCKCQHIFESLGKYLESFVRQTETRYSILFMALGCVYRYVDVEILPG